MPKDQYIKDINDECGEMYEEIMDTRKLLKWNNSRLLATCIPHIDIEECSDIYLDENYETIKAKYKKIFQRKSWNKRTAKLTTFNALKGLRDAIYTTDEYNKIKTSLSPNLREYMRRKSNKLQRKLKEQLDN